MASSDNLHGLNDLTNSTFNLMMNEIDQTETTAHMKELWCVGSECEVYSRSEKKWVPATVIKLFSDDEGEWLVLQYLNNKIKEIQRYSKYIRPMAKHQLSDQDTDDIEDNKSEAHHSMFDLVRNKNYVIKDDDDVDVNWDQLLSAIRSGDVRFIKNVITSNDIDINEQHPLNGKTLLIYCVIIGNFELVRVVCNFGADVHIKDNDECDALHYALQYGQYRITELLYYRQLSGSLGNDLKDIATKLYQKKRESKLIKSFKTENAYSDDDHLYHMIIKYMIKTIKEREVFGKDMLFYAWYFVLNGEKTKDNPLDSELFRTMMNTYTEILCDTSDKAGWKWLRDYYLPSLIWYLPHPNSKSNDNETDCDADDDADDVESILRNTLFWELLKRVRKESQRQSDLLLKDEISTIKREKMDEWKQLTEYNVVTECSSNSRQDTVGCLQSEYSEQDLSEDIYPPSTHFSAKKHYDKNIYLNQLLFTANILDSMFQKDVKTITKQICNDSDGEIVVGYRAGPVKTLKRSQTKVENDYINEDYPTSAKILDINRCALQFTNIKSMMKFIEIFSEKIEMQKARSIKQIIRVKNGWSVWDPDHPQYTDIKLNVLIQSSHDKTQMIVAELQLLLDLMSAFKKKAHKLYGVERKFELVYNYNKLVAHVQSFKDNIDLNATLIDLAKRDDIKYFKLLWNTIQSNSDTLVDYDKLVRDVWHNSLFHIIYKNGAINNYLKNEFSELYEETIIKYIKTYTKKYGFMSDKSWSSRDPEKPGFLESVSSNRNEIDCKDIMLTKFLRELFSSFQNDSKKLKKMLAIKDEENNNIIDGISETENKYKQSINLILNTSMLSDKERLKIFKIGQYGTGSFNAALRNRYFDTAMEMIKYLKNDKFIFCRIFKGDIKQNRSLLFAICQSKDRLSNITLRLIYYNPIISVKERDKIFYHTADDGTTALYYAVKKGYYQNVQFILDHFGKNNKKKIIKWLIFDTKYVLFDADDKCILLILRYFKNDRRYILQLLTRTNKDDKTRVFDEICRENKLESLKFILYECPAINHRDIVNLLCNEKYLKDKSPIFDTSDGIFKSGIEIIKYFKNDRKSFYRLLSCLITDGMNVLMAICDSVDDDNEENNKNVLKWILQESALNDRDIYKLFSFKNREYKTSLYYAMGAYLESYIDIVFDALTHNNFDPKLLTKLLCQETEKEDQICAMECNKKHTTLRIMKHCDMVNNKTIFPKLLSEQNELRRDFKRTVEKYQQYLELKHLENRMASIDTYGFFFDFKKKMVINTLTIKGKIKIRRKQKRLETENERKDQEKLFAAACYLGKTKTIKKILDNFIDDDIGTYLGWLEDDGGELMKSVLSQHKENDNILKLILLENSLISQEDAVDPLSKSWRADQSVLFDAQNHHLISIMDYFKDHADILCKLLSEQKEGKKMQVFDYIAELKEKTKNETLKRIAKYMKKKDILRLLNHKFIIKIYDEEDNDRVEYEETSFRNACFFGGGGELIKWAKNDRNILLKLLWIKCNNKAIQLNAKYSRLTPLQLICRGNFEDRDDRKFEDVETVRFLLNDSALNYKDKIDIISCKYQNDRGTVLHIACEYGKDSKNASEIIHYFRNDAKTLLDLISVKTKKDGDTCIIKAVKHGKLEFIKTIFHEIKDNKVILKLLSIKNSNFVTAHDIAREMSAVSGYLSRRERRERNYTHNYEIEELIGGFLDYLKFHQLLNKNAIGISLLDEEYGINPFITSCRFGKQKTIKKLLNYINTIDDDENTKFKKLLLNNYDIENGNNGLIIAAENGYNEIILEILNNKNIKSLQLKIDILSMENFNGETILTVLCKNDNNFNTICKILDDIDCDKNIIHSLLTKKDMNHKTCLDYAQMHKSNNINKYIKQYL